MHRQRRVRSRPGMMRFKLNELWTERDKKMLLKGLREYGYTDVENLAKLLPNKSIVSIRAMIRKNMFYARRINKQILTSPIDQWIDRSSERKADCTIPEALLCIMLYETHPASENFNGCDFRAAYDFIRRMTLGYPTIDLSPGTRKTVYKLITRMVASVLPRDPFQFFSVNDESIKKKKPKDYTRKSVASQQITIGSVLEELNTFKLLPERLRAPSKT